METPFVSHPICFTPRGSVGLIQLQKALDYVGDLLKEPGSCIFRHRDVLKHPGVFIFWAHDTLEQHAG